MRLCLIHVAVCLRFRRIYATPSIILRASGSVGVAFIMWLLGSSIAALGTAVYVELGTVSPPGRDTPMVADVWNDRVYRATAGRKTISSLCTDGLSS